MEELIKLIHRDDERVRYMAISAVMSVAS